MNKDSTSKALTKGQWKQIRGQAKTWWGKLSDKDLDQINGDHERLIGLLQERYGYTREQAINEVDRRLKDLEQIAMPAH